MFAASVGDLSIGDVDGGSLRVSKDLGEKWKAVASVMHKGNGDLDNDNRQTVGFLFKDGNWTVWAEGIHMDGNAAYPNSKWAATGGAQYKFSDKQRIVVSGSYIADALTRISLAYEVQVATNLYVAPELVYIIKADGTGDWQAIARTEYRFSTK